MFRYTLYAVFIPQLIMIFRPGHVSKIWDTWMYFHQGTYYLYYLITEHSPGEGVGLATSKDGVRWHDHGWILRMAEDALWLGTGAVWKASSFEQDGRFIMNFSEWRGPEMGVGQQTIFFAESTDLIHWKRLGSEYEFAPDPRYYRRGEGESSRWDCIYPIPRQGGGYYGYWTANPTDMHPGFGFGESIDGTHWNALPAPRIEWGGVPPFSTMEAGAAEKFGDQYFAMLCTYHGYQGYSRGVFGFVADSPHGPYCPAAKNFALLTSPKGLNATYFARFFPVPGAMLVNHHSITRGDERYFAPLKKAVVDDAGALRLMYWEGNEALKGEPISFPNSSTQQYNLEQGVIFEGHIQAKDELPLTFVLENQDGSQTQVRIHNNHMASFGVLDASFREENRVDRSTTSKASYSFCLLLRYSLIELYLDDHLIQCFSIKENVTGRIGIVLYGGTVISNTGAFKMI